MNKIAHTMLGKLTIEAHAIACSVSTQIEIEITAMGSNVSGPAAAIDALIQEIHTHGYLINQVLAVRVIPARSIIVTLKHGDAIRLDGWNCVGFCEVGTDADYMKAAGIASNSLKAWTCYSGAMLTNDRRHYEAKVAKAAAAVTVQSGQIVRINGRRYLVRVVPGNLNGPRNSDPIHFELMAGSDRMREVYRATVADHPECNRGTGN